MKDGCVCQRVSGVCEIDGNEADVGGMVGYVDA